VGVTSCHLMAPTPWASPSVGRQRAVSARFSGTAWSHCRLWRQVLEPHLWARQPPKSPSDFV